ncbi:hypothetical protein [Arboricoccus pini]|uniref:hypothetical protein n=1 Tax=Arboricoccus pini TaxID=1963835 RepID=UPI0013FD4855|nr:hypothetical protein [Arboricoccus pini]
MLGLSIGKLFILVLVVLAAWRGMRIISDIRIRAQALDARRRAAAHRAPQGGARAWPPGPDAAFEAARATTDLVACPRCGTYVPNGTICRSTDECRFRR